MQNRETDTQTLIKALRILSNDIQSEDGIANAAILEGADRIEKLLELVDGVYEVVECYTPNGEHAAKLKVEWLKTARQYGAGPDI